MKRALPIVAWLGRMTFALALTALLIVVAVQFSQMIGRNVAASRELRAIERDVAGLREKKIEQERNVARLSDPHGAIPEIHDRLHQVGPREAIIYLKGDPQPER